jgi:hypothetical protein
LPLAVLELERDRGQLWRDVTRGRESAIRQD